MSVAKIEIDYSFSPADEEKAKQELREVPEVTEPAYAELKKLIEAEKTLHYDTSRDVLQRYLRPCKYYPESALELIKREADFKKKYSKLLQDLVPSTIEKIILGKAPVNVLANRDQDGRRILIQNAGKAWNTSEISTDQIFQIFYLVHQIALLEPKTQVNGVVVILDFNGMGLKQVGNISPTFALQLLTFIQKAMPLRLKGVHIVNEPMIFKVVWKLFQPLIEDKLKGRLFFHGSKRESLHKHINPDCLPASYGGSLPEINYSSVEWYPVMKSVESIIEKNNANGLA